MQNNLNVRHAAGWMLLWAVVFTLVSCDPAQVINIENKTDDQASIRFVFKKGSQYTGFGEFPDADTMLLELDSTKNNSSRRFHFGIGTWKVQSSFDSLVAAVTSIEVETSKSKETFIGEGQVRAFFESRISGSQKEVIEISIE